MELKEMIKVMQHYDNGGDVEFSDDKFKTLLGEANKEDAGELCWDWDEFDYRIKEQKQNVTIEKWLIKDVDSGEHFIIGTSDIELNLKDFPEWKKVKLLETNVYEVEL